jgi:uncharacterized protein YndB with AHSA1/START domain
MKQWRSRSTRAGHRYREVVVREWQTPIRPLGSPRSHCSYGKTAWTRCTPRWRGGTRSKEHDVSQILGSLRAANGKGAARIETRYDTDIQDLWSAITDPERLARWYGRVDGDLRPGGKFRLYVEASQWEGIGRIDTCEPPRHLLATTRQSDESWQHGEIPYDEVIEATLTEDGERSILVVEASGLPLGKLPYYGAGWQHNVETLAAYLAGREPEGEERFEEIVPSYLELAAKLT